MNKSNESNDQIIGEIHDYQINPASREIYLHSHVESEDDPGVEYKMAVKFVKNLHILDFRRTSNILVHMRTPRRAAWGAWCYRRLQSEFSCPTARS